MEFEFECRRATKEDIKELIFQEILEYHPQLLKEHISGTERPNFHHLSPYRPMYLTSFFWSFSVVDQFRKQFTQVEENLNGSGAAVSLQRKHSSLPRSTIVHSAAIPAKDYKHVASSSTKLAVDGSWNTQIQGVHANIAGEPSTIVRPAVSSERSLAPTLQWQPNMTHFLNHALCYQNTVFSGSLLDATGPAQAIPRTTPYVDSRSGNLDLYQHHVSREDVQSDTATAQAHAASHGPVPAVSYSLPGTYRIT
uniref:Mitogen-activated protein kinase n=1 Tax=Oryza glumipatula TaxID=40148 RepID=A0A0E0A9J7_9ORYZ